MISPNPCMCIKIKFMFRSLSDKIIRNKIELGLNNIYKGGNTFATNF
jgi:hypothetical protein